METTAARQQIDEQAIHQLMENWFAATKAGDLKTVLSLMADDVIFMVPGQEPFGKKEFAERFTGMGQLEIESKGEIKEIEIHGDWAWMRNHLQIAVTPKEGQTLRRSGYVLTILRKNTDGRWVLFRDANLLTQT